MKYYNKLIITALIFLIPKIGFPQSNNQLNVIEYNFFSIQENRSLINTTLYIKNKESVHLYSNLNSKSNFDEQNLTFEINFSKEDVLFYKNFSNGTITYKDYIFSKSFIVKDSIPKIIWQIYDEEKTIANTYVCKKAIGKFRGRTYTAWFTEQIPISNGPWKLGGLPGLILEASDEKKEVVFEFVSLRQSNDNKEFVKKLENIHTKKTISWEEYAKLFRKKIKQLQPALQSQTSGNVSIKVTKINLIEKSILEDEN